MRVGVVWTFFSLVYRFSFLSPSLWETARYRLKYCLKGPLSSKQSINQPSLWGTARCRLIWLVGCFGFNGPLRQYSSLYRAVSQREGEKGEKGQMRVKMSKQPPPSPTASTIGPCSTIIRIVGRPDPGSLPRTLAPPNRPRCRLKYWLKEPLNQKQTKQTSFYHQIK